MSQYHPEVPPESPMDSPRAITAQALKFLGLLLACGGSLALIRTGERSLFFASMMPIGIVLWVTGFRMLGKIAAQHASENPSQQTSPPPSQPQK